MLSSMLTMWPSCPLMTLCTNGLHALVSIFSGVGKSYVKRGASSVNDPKNQPKKFIMGQNNEKRIGVVSIATKAHIET